MYLEYLTEDTFQSIFPNPDSGSDDGFDQGFDIIVEVVIVVSYL